jgi:hypothetical protein
MAAFDPNQAAQQAATGYTPPGWTLFPIRKQTLYVGLLAIVAMAVFGVGVAIYMLAQGVYYVPAFVPTSATSGAAGLVINLIEVLFFAGLGVYCAYLTIRGIGQLGNTNRHFFLVTQEGWVLARGNKITGLAFADTLGIRLKTGNGPSQIIVQPRTGKPLMLNVSTAFGPPRELAAYLLQGIKMAEIQRQAGQQFR